MIREGNEVARARVRVLTREEGGRGSDVNSGYRGWFILEGADGDVSHDCVLSFAPAKNAIRRSGELWLQPGMEDIALVAPFDPDRARRVLVPGTRFRVREGEWTVVAGEITAPLQPER